MKAEDLVVCVKELRTGNGVLLLESGKEYTIKRVTSFGEARYLTLIETGAIIWAADRFRMSDERSSSTRVEDVSLMKSGKKMEGFIIDDMIVIEMDKTKPSGPKKKRKDKEKS